MRAIRITVLVLVKLIVFFIKFSFAFSGNCILL